MRKKERVYVTDSRAGGNVDWSLRVCVGLVPTAVVNLVVIDRPEPLIGMFVSPQLQVDSILVE